MSSQRRLAAGDNNNNSIIASRGDTAEVLFSDDRLRAAELAFFIVRPSDRPTDRPDGRN